MKRILLSAALACLFNTPLHAQIFADFETSVGNFTCELNHTAAPKTVANFVGLAEGTRKWVSPSGTIQEGHPFYNGLIFHRVIAGFMNQAGCQLGTGSSGPGYVFPDETTGGPIHEPYVISMANSSGYTNGSQFFITVPRPPNLSFTHLNGNHTVFGTVTSGRDIVDQINATPVGAGDLPVNPIVIQSVSIRRVGTAATTFDVQSQGLPEISATVHDLELNLPTMVKAVPRSARSATTTTSTYASEDLQSWELASRDYVGLGSGSTNPFPIAVPYGFAQYPEKEFYRFTEAINPDAIVPASLGGKTLSVTWPGNNLIFSFNAEGTGGTATLGDEETPRNIIAVHETHSPYDFLFEVSGLIPLKISASLTSSEPTLDSGTHKISGFTNSWFVVGRGTMTITK